MEISPNNRVLNADWAKSAPLVPHSAFAAGEPNRWAHNQMRCQGFIS